jgi:hypothetical protein
MASGCEFKYPAAEKGNGWTVVSSGADKAAAILRVQTFYSAAAHQVVGNRE